MSFSRFYPHLLFSPFLILLIPWFAPLPPHSSPRPQHFAPPSKAGGASCLTPCVPRDPQTPHTILATGTCPSTTCRLQRACRVLAPRMRRLYDSPAGDSPSVGCHRGRGGLVEKRLRTGGALSLDLARGQLASVMSAGTNTLLWNCRQPSRTCLLFPSRD